MAKVLFISLKLGLLLALLTGVLYPLLIHAVANVCFPYQAQGSILMRHGRPVGSELIGQQFRSSRYFSSRPTAAGDSPLPSGGSNLGPTSGLLRDSVLARRRAFSDREGLPPGFGVPDGMLFASGSGVDPQVSPEAARAQIGRIARARGWNAERTAELRELVEHLVEGPQLGFLGEPRVNVLRLNLALDTLGEH
jgi:K+-transporting ATPase ATPase C chain